MAFGAALIGKAYAAPGNLDLTFDAGSALNGSPVAIALQPDGKLLIGGVFTTVSGLVRPGIARLNVDGTGDASFDSGTGISGGVKSVVLQPDGKVLVGGWFTEVDGVPRHRIARLNADGSLDRSFDPGAGADNGVLAIALQPDGKVLLAGSFTQVNGVRRNSLARLNADGSLDGSFDPGTGPNSHVASIALQPDAKILVGGLFTAINGISRKGIARLQTNGSVDSGFDPGERVNGYVFAIALQPDGKAVIGGYFFKVNGTSGDCIARLNAEGSLDGTFNPSGTSEIISLITLQPDGKILVGGQFREFNGVPRPYLARLSPVGALDTGWNPAMVAYPPGIVCLALQADGKLLVSGGLVQVDGQSREGFARLHADGTLDTHFDPNPGIKGHGVFSLVPQPDGKLIVAGNFSDIAGQPRQGIGRLLGDGRLDDSFAVGTMGGEDFFSIGKPVVAVYTATLQSDGKILIGGTFTNIAGKSRDYVARLNPDGSLDARFIPALDRGDIVWEVVAQPDGKVIVAGDFIKRLNPDGSVDRGFRPAFEPFGPIALQGDGKLLVAGFTLENGTIRHHIARLSADGSLDASFHAQLANSFVSAIVVQPDGKVLVGGWFTNVNGLDRNRIVRLNPDGRVDPSFDPGRGPDERVMCLALQPNGKVLLAGAFTNVDGITRPHLARLHPNGKLDASFSSGTGVDSEVYSLAVQSRDRVVVGGIFSTVNGVARSKVARLYLTGGGPGARMETLSMQTTGPGRLRTSATSGAVVVIEASTNLVDWQGLGVFKADAAGSLTFDDTEAGQIPARFYRVVSPAP